MEQSVSNGVVRPKTTKRTSSSIRFKHQFIKQVKRITDKANKKDLGRRIKLSEVLEQIFNQADEALIEKAIKICQEKSLSPEDKKAIFIKDKLSQFQGTREEFDQKMMELMENYLESQKDRQE